MCIILQQVYVNSYIEGFFVALAGLTAVWIMSLNKHVTTQLMNIQIL